MKKILFVYFAAFTSMTARSEEIVDRVKVTGFHCQWNRAAIKLRSLSQDRVLYLTKTREGEPEYLEVSTCEGLIRNLHQQLTGKIFDQTFLMDEVTREERVSYPSPPCRPRQRKCDDSDRTVRERVTYIRLQTTIGDYRFLSETKK